MFFERHKDKQVVFGKDGRIGRLDGYSAEEIVRLLEALPRAKAAHRALGSEGSDEGPPGGEAPPSP